MQDSHSYLYCSPIVKTHSVVGRWCVTSTLKIVWCYTEDEGVEHVIIIDNLLRWKGLK